MSIKSFNASPLYVQLRTDLTRRIARGDWKRGENIPNELDLAREYGLSPGTVRKALDWMEEVHLIVRQQGRGTFVATASSDDINRRFDRLRTLTGKPVRLEMQDIESGIGAATFEEAEHLAIAPDAPVYRLARKGSARGKPMLLERLTVALGTFPSLERPAARYDLAELAQADGVLLGYGTESLSLVSCEAAIAGHLGLADGRRVILLERTISTIENQPAEWRQCWCDLEGYRYQVELH